MIPLFLKRNGLRHSHLLSENQNLGCELTLDFLDCLQKSLLELCLEALEFFGIVCATI